jgi:hypothetical protein
MGSPHLRAARLTVLSLVLGALASAVVAAEGFSYLELTPSGLKAQNGVPVEVRRPAGFTAAAPESRSDVFGKHPYLVTLAGFLGAGEAVLVHAERVADASGASDYSALPPGGWPGFRVRSQCAEIDPQDVAAEHDLKWLADHGWNPAGALALRQYFRTTDDHNNEVVVSLIVRVADCRNAAAVDEALARLKAKVEVR